MVSFTLVVIAVSSGPSVGPDAIPPDTSKTMTFVITTGASAGVPPLTKAGKESVDDLEHRKRPIEGHSDAKKAETKDTYNKWYVAPLASTPTSVIAPTAPPGLPDSPCFVPATDGEMARSGTLVTTETATSLVVVSTPSSICIDGTKVM